ncbi:MAG: hypothetical protein QW324_06275 [Thermofilaceae archaeon]
MPGANVAQATSVGEAMEAKARREQRERSLVDLVDLLFREVDFIVEPSQSPVNIPVHTVTQSNLVEHMETRVYKLTVSHLGPRHLVPGAVPVRSLPNWHYSEVDPSFTVEKAVSIVMEALKGNSVYTTAYSHRDLTPLSDRSMAFRVSRQMIEAVEKATTVRVSYLQSANGGVDIVATVESASEPGKHYAVAIHVGPSEKDESVPAVSFACSCPLSGKEVICKHLIAVMGASAHIVLGAVDYVASGRIKQLDEYVSYWAERLRRVFDEHRSTVERAAVYYYLVRFLHRKGLLMKATDASIIAPYAERIAGGDMAWMKDEGLLSAETVEVAEKVTEFTGAGVQVRVKWTEEMEEIRRKILGMVFDLNRRFGDAGPTLGEWPVLLGFAAVASSLATPSRPPVVLHAVGDIGTFKTTAPRLLTQYIELPELELVYTGDNVKEKYHELLELLSKHFGVPVSEVENRIGGVITALRTYKGEIRAVLSLQHLLSRAVEANSRSALLDFLSDVKRAGFRGTVRMSQPRIAVLDPAQLSNIEDYRMKYVPDENMGILTQMDVFDNYVVVVDEGCRNLHGLENLLTKMSVSTTNESVRVIVVTDNLEPFVESVRNPRYGALHDRTFKALTRSVRDEQTVSENLLKPPSVKLSVLELMAAQRFINEMPLPPGLVLFARALMHALSHKYTVAQLLGEKKGVKYLKPISRDERAVAEFDAFSGVNFRFIPGNRFTHHTITLSRFLAFLRGHDHVTLEDFADSLAITVKSRLVVDASTIKDYKSVAISVGAVVRSLVERSEQYIARALKLLALIEKGDRDEVSRELSAAIRDCNFDPFVCAITVATLENAWARGRIRVDALPDNVKYTLAAVLMESEDLAHLEPLLSAIEELKRSEQLEVKRQ